MSFLIPIGNNWIGVFSCLSKQIWQKEFQKLKVDMELKYEEFNRQRDSCKKVLDDIKRDVAIERSTLISLRRESNEYRRKIRHLEKKIINLGKCQPAKGNSKDLENS